MKKRVYFDKYGEMRFISHLDLLRFLERLFKKVDLPIKYSNGYHPRPKMSFGNPISLGTEAFGEVMDIEIEEDLSDEEVLVRLNSAKVLGFAVQKVETLEGKHNIAEEYPYIRYTIEGSEEVMAPLKSLLAQDEILQEKIRKGKPVTRELKERILDMKWEGSNLEIITKNVSPNAYLDLAKISQQDVKIKRLGYIPKEERGEETC